MIFQNQIKGLLENIEKPLNPIDMDIVLEGGGFNGSFELGILMMLQEMEKQNYIKINRFSGASIGAILCLSYLINDLENYINYYGAIRESWREKITLNKIHENIEHMCNQIDDDTFNLIKKDKLYITYHNVNTKEQIIQSQFKSKKDIKNALLKTSFIPYLTNNDAFFKEDNDDLSNNYQDEKEINKNENTEQFFIDGGQPFIFHNREKSNSIKILYIRINSITDIHKMFITSNEKNPYGRILNGMIDCYEFFKRNMGINNKSHFCSYVNDWNTLDFLLLRVKHIGLIIILYIIDFIKKVYTQVNPHINNYEVFKLLKSIFGNLYNDFILNNCF